MHASSAVMYSKLLSTVILLYELRGPEDSDRKFRTSSWTGSGGILEICLRISHILVSWKAELRLLVRISSLILKTTYWVRLLLSDSCCDLRAGEHTSGDHKLRDRRLWVGNRTMEGGNSPKSKTFSTYSCYGNAVPLSILKYIQSHHMYVV